MCGCANVRYAPAMSTKHLRNHLLGTCLLALATQLLAWGAPAGAGEAVTPVVNRDYLPTLLGLIHGATQSIEFIQLECNDDRIMAQVEAALAAAVQRGVAVRGLLDDGVDFNAAAVARLQPLGVDVKLDTPAKMTHAKVVIVDGRVVLLGSTNWTGNSMYNNNESNVLVADPAIADYFARYLATLWADSAAEPELSPLISTAVQTVINRQYFSAVLALFQTATQRIHVVMYGINYSPKYAGSKVNQLVEALAAAAERGVAVSVTMDLSDYNHTLNNVNRAAKDYLMQAGVTVFDDPLKTTTHAKVIVADDAVVIGSVNWGRDALEKRNEAAVLVRDRSVADFFADYAQRPEVSAARRQLAAKKSPPEGGD